MSYPKCPYCGGSLEGKVAHPPMSNRRLNIYHAVLESGANGIAVKDLVVRMYNGQKPTLSARSILRVQVFETNKLLAPYGFKIQSNRSGRYHLKSTREN